MKVAIMQPTFLPWLGYFALIEKVDKFVFLDSVQFESRSWQQRNRILVNEKPHWITVPTVCPSGRSTLIRDVRVNFEHYSGNRFESIIRRNYSRCPGIKDLTSTFFGLILEPPELLSKFNVALIKLISNQIGIQTEFVKASNLEAKGEKAELLLNICRELKASTYVSPPGSRNYLQNFDGFRDNSILLEYLDFTHPQYYQNTPEFISHLSIVDVICHTGNVKTFQFIRDGLK